MTWINVARRNHNWLISIWLIRINKYTQMISRLRQMSYEESEWNGWLGVNGEKIYLRLIKIKVDKCIKTIRLMKFKCPKMNIGRLRIPYNQICIVVSYSSKMWNGDLMFKYQQEIIQRIQRKVLLSLSDTYSTTSTAKLRIKSIYLSTVPDSISTVLTNSAGIHTKIN